MKVSRHKICIVPGTAAEQEIERMDEAGYDLAHMAATDRGGFGAVVQVVLHFQVRGGTGEGATDDQTAPESGEARLTAKQDLFVSEYLSNGGNATRAALAAGYSESRAEVTGCELLRNRKVTEAIQTRKI